MNNGGYTPQQPPVQRQRRSERARMQEQEAKKTAAAKPVQQPSSRTPRKQEEWQQGARPGQQGYKPVQQPKIPKPNAVPEAVSNVTSAITPSLAQLRLKRRRALSRDSFSLRRTSDIVFPPSDGIRLFPGCVQGLIIRLEYYIC